jgi:hypothetical protein
LTDEIVKLGDKPQPRKRYERLSLLGFLHHVLETAELNKMHKGLHGKRSWNVMRGRILETMRAQETSRYRDLAAFSFAPRIFSLEHKDELFRDWRAIERKAGIEKRSILLFAELKDIDAGEAHAGRAGDCQLTFKHLPQRRFALKSDIQKPFLDALERITGLMTGPRGAGHVITCAVVTVGEGDALSIAAIAMTASTPHWRPKSFSAASSASVTRTTWPCCPQAPKLGCETFMSAGRRFTLATTKTVWRGSAVS